MDLKYKAPFLEQVIEGYEESGSLCKEEDLALYYPATHPFNPIVGLYTGKDFQFRVNEQVPITAVQEGTVVRIDKTKHKKEVNHWKAHRTNYVVVNQTDGIKAKYTHIFSELKVGDRVKQGDYIGEVGGYRGGSHIHLEFYKERGILLPKKIVDVCGPQNPILTILFL